MDERLKTFETHRPLMFSIAYRMLGSAMEAEDIVQEAYLRYRDTPPETIQSHRAFLSTVVTRLCLDQLKSARTQREVYTGPWLPEPIMTSEDDDTLRPKSDEYDSLSLAMLVLLESLTPAERAVFLLRAVFDYSYAEISQMLDKDEAACRQLFSRAQKHVHEHRPRFKPSPEKHNEMLMRFIQAASSGDLAGLTNLLAQDVTWWSDGGGKVTAARRPLHGPDAVARFVLGLVKQAPPNVRTDIAEINGKAALLLRFDDNPPFYVITFEISDTHIHEVRAIGNPDKLKFVS